MYLMFCFYIHHELYHHPTPDFTQHSLRDEATKWISRNYQPILNTTDFTQHKIVSHPTFHPTKNWTVWHSMDITESIYFVISSHWLAFESLWSTLNQVKNGEVRESGGVQPFKIFPLRSTRNRPTYLRSRLPTEIYFPPTNTPTQGTVSMAHLRNAMNSLIFKSFTVTAF